MKADQAADKLLQLRLFSFAALLSLGGLADSVYLTVKQLSGADAGCLVFAGCSGVLSSSYASVGRIPLGALGTLGYLAAFSLATMAAFGYSGAQTYLIVLVAGMLGTTVWLLYVQAFVLYAFCVFCLVSAASTLSLSAIVVAGCFIRKRQGKLTKQVSLLES